MQPPGDRKSGSTRILYDTNLSERGVLQCVGRQPRRASAFDYTPPLVIKTFGALPLFREEQQQKRKREVGGWLVYICPLCSAAAAPWLGQFLQNSRHLVNICVHT